MKEYQVTLEIKLKSEKGDRSHSSQIMYMRNDEVVALKCTLEDLGSGKGTIWYNTYLGAIEYIPISEISAAKLNIIECKEE